MIVGIQVIAAGIGIAMIRREEAEGTFDLLLSAPLDPAVIVRGKVLAGLFGLSCVYGGAGVGLASSPLARDSVATAIASGVAEAVVFVGVNLVALVLTLIVATAWSTRTSSWWAAAAGTAATMGIILGLCPSHPVLVYLAAVIGCSGREGLDTVLGLGVVGSLIFACGYGIMMIMAFSLAVSGIEARNGRLNHFRVLPDVPPGG